MIVDKLNIVECTLFYSNVLHSSLVKFIKFYLQSFFSWNSTSKKYSFQSFVRMVHSHEENVCENQSINVTNFQGCYNIKFINANKLFMSKIGGDCLLEML